MAFGIRRSRVTIAAADWLRTVQFYESLLQLSPQGLLPDRYAEFRLPDMTIVLYFPKLEERSDAAALTHPSLSLCLYVDSLDAAIDHLRSSNMAMPESVQYSSHGQEIYIYDPNGNRIILYQPNSQLET
jgi:predicted enzyme related to lactoylglutathione lyase